MKTNFKIFVLLLFMFPSNGSASPAPSNGEFLFLTAAWAGIGYGIWYLITDDTENAKSRLIDESKNGSKKFKLHVSPTNKQEASGFNGIKLQISYSI